MDNEEQLYAVAESKNLLVERVGKAQNADGGCQFKVDKLMRLRGHTERINDLHAYNTRILGSSSD